MTTKTRNGNYRVEDNRDGAILFFRKSECESAAKAKGYSGMSEVENDQENLAVWIINSVFKPFRTIEA